MYLVTTGIICIDEDFVSNDMRTERGLFSKMEHAQNYIEDIILRSKLRWEKRSDTYWERSPGQSTLKQEVFDLDLGDGSYIEIQEFEVDKPQLIKFEKAPTFKIEDYQP